MIRSLMCAAVVMCCGGASGQEADLKYAPAHKAGQMIKDQTRNTIAQTLTIAGMNVVTKAEQFLITAETVGEPNGNGTLPMTGKFETFQSSNDIQGMKFEFNSSNPDEAKAPIPQLEPVLDYIKRLAKSEWVAVYDDKGMLKSYEFKGNPFEGVAEELTTQYKLENLQENQKQDVERLPGKVKKGDKWKRNERVNLGQGQWLNTEVEYSYAGPETSGGKSLEKITQKLLSVSLSVDPNPNSPVMIKESKLDGSESESTLLYDPKLGRIVNSKMRLHLKGDLTLVVNGMELPSMLDLTIEGSSEITVSQ